MKALKAGDRVRLAQRNSVKRYRPGDKGTVLWVSQTNAVGLLYYLVAMDRDEPGAGVCFNADEIEGD